MVDEQISMILVKKSRFDFKVSTENCVELLDLFKIM
jgi:hypothetical protein